VPVADLDAVRVAELDRTTTQPASPHAEPLPGALPHPFGDGATGDADGD